jgi:selenophosphate synthase
MKSWAPSLAEIVKWCTGFEVQSRAEMKPCGCSVKLDLQDVVYPALRQVGLASRVDAHVHAGKIAESRRLVIPLKDLSAKADSWASAIAEFGAESVIELFSTSSDYFKERDKTRAEFAKFMSEKSRILDLASRLSGKPLKFGKGHSIRAGGDMLIFDLLRYAPGSGYSLSNNDTIITADSLLRHDSPVTVFTALNNALNDLFLMGVTEELTVFPVYGGSAEQVRNIQAALVAYQEFYKQRRAALHIQDSGPLENGLKIVGATVTGQARHELPGLSGLQPGQILLATRSLGDLSVLAMHRELHFPLSEHPEMDQLRLEVLQRMTMPNFAIAGVLRKFLPNLGEQFDSSRHLTFSTDISGPGLSVLEEGARASGVDVYIENMQFIDERSLRFYRKNQTSSTNGPILLAARPQVAERLERELKLLGLTELWTVGRVISSSVEPTVYINPELQARYHSDNPRTDFFSPEVHFGDAKNPEKVRMQIFERFRFERPKPKKKAA